MRAAARRILEGMSGHEVGNWFDQE